MTKQEIIAYLDTHRKSEQKDPEHKWKAATYNHYLTALIRFYRRLKYPNLEQLSDSSTPNWNRYVILCLSKAARRIQLCFALFLHRLVRRFASSVTNL